MVKSSFGNFGNAERVGLGELVDRRKFCHEYYPHKFLLHQDQKRFTKKTASIFFFLMPGSSASPGPEAGNVSFPNRQLGNVWRRSARQAPSGIFPERPEHSLFLVECLFPLVPLSWVGRRVHSSRRNLWFPGAKRRNGNLPTSVGVSGFPVSGSESANREPTHPF